MGKLTKTVIILEGKIIFYNFAFQTRNCKSFL